MTSWLPSGSNIPVGGSVSPPPKWLDLLERRPDLASAKSSPARVLMTTAKFMRLSQVHTGVNNRIKYRRDLGDKWEVADTEGDCEDYDLAYMVRFIGYGWPRGALRLTLCELPRPVQYLGPTPPPARYHAVLQIETDHGTWVLDNRMRYPRLWTRLPYRWLYRECPGRDDWERIFKEDQLLESAVKAAHDVA